MAPWTAAIFRKATDKTSEWEFLCSGTITGPSTIITSARCLMPRVFGPKLSTRPHHIRYLDLQVVAGLLTTDLSSKDQYTQFGIVGQIRDVYEQESSGDTPEGDLAGIRLTNKLNFSTPYIKQVALLERPGTLLEANETKPGEILLVAGYENPSAGGVKTRAQQDRGSSLKLTQVTIESTAACIDRYVAAYPTYYFNALCGQTLKKSDVIPCHFQGSGLVKMVRDATGDVTYYLFGVYSSNSALATTEGTLVDKNKMAPPPCTSSDIIFFFKYAQLGRWAISNNFCDSDLAMCKNDRCRPWVDLCSAEEECEDGSDEVEKICFNQAPDCAKDKSKFRCTYGVCIDKKLACDGIKDCKDGSDEDTNGVCKGKTIPLNTNNSTCEGIKTQQSVAAYCSHPGRKGLSCSDPVPLGTTAVLRSNEIVVNCKRDGKWSRSTRLTC